MAGYHLAEQARSLRNVASEGVLLPERNQVAQGLLGDCQVIDRCRPHIIVVDILLLQRRILQEALVRDYFAVTFDSVKNRVDLSLFTSENALKLLVLDRYRHVLLKKILELVKSSRVKRLRKLSERALTSSSS